MFRLGLISDSHGSPAAVRRAQGALGPLDMLVHLGDGAGDVDQTLLGKCRFLQLKGNCDPDTTLSREIIERLPGGIGALFCHGDRWNVKMSLDRLVYHAAECQVQLACFGHTHRGLVEYVGGVLLVNPGSCRGYDASCCRIEVEDGRIRPRMIGLS
jgi:putative phosphoesterase